MPESQLTLSVEEHQFLLELLRETLQDTRVEEHRTRAPRYREVILKKEHVILALLEKLGARAS